MTQVACWCLQSSGHTVVMVQAVSDLESVSQQKLFSDVLPTHACSVIPFQIVDLRAH